MDHGVYGNALESIITCEQLVALLISFRLKAELDNMLKSVGWRTCLLKFNLTHQLHSELLVSIVEQLRDYHLVQLVAILYIRCFLRLTHL